LATSPNLDELFEMIERRPQSFLRHLSLWELELFVNGFNFRGFALGLADDTGYSAFVGEWLYERLAVVDRRGWQVAILDASKSESEAFHSFFELWREYRVATASQNQRRPQA